MLHWISLKGKQEEEGRETLPRTASTLKLKADADISGEEPVKN